MTPNSKNGVPRRQPDLAYRNPKFVESPEGRPLRLLGEYLEPQVRLRRARVENTVVFFGSARLLSREEAERNLRAAEAAAAGDPAAKPSPVQLTAALKAVEMSRYYEEARELARLITRWSLSLHHGRNFLVVCSGGGPGIMEAANRGAAEAGGVSIGLNIKLPSEQKSNPYVTPELNFVFKYFFMRKLWFAQPARALIVFPGGYGTFDELFEFLNLIETRKLGHHAVILLYGSDYWNRVVNFNAMVEAGTISEEDHRLIRVANTPKEAFEVLRRELRRNREVRAALRRPFP
jgi:uncharacterized protein (TIGR00730 family)